MNINISKEPELSEGQCLIVLTTGFINFQSKKKKWSFRPRYCSKYKLLITIYNFYINKWRVIDQIKPKTQPTAKCSTGSDCVIQLKPRSRVTARGQGRFISLHHLILKVYRNPIRQVKRMLFMASQRISYSTQPPLRGTFRHQTSEQR